MSAISVAWLSVSWGAVTIETNYGLMQHSPYEITEKLLKALDKEYNVVDYATVFEVVTILEKIPVTHEILESTRLGKYINGIRRKTTNEVLAKRTKDLVRHWRDVMNIGGRSSVSSQQNGTPVRYKAECNVLNNDRSSISPSLSCDPKVESVPKTHAANKRLRKDTTPDSIEVPVKKSRLNGVAGRSKQVLFPADIPHQDVTVNNISNHVVVVNDMSQVSQHPNFSQSVESVPDSEPPLPKKRGRKKGAKKNYDIIKEKLQALTKTVKVKTTQELVNDLKSRSDDGLKLYPIVSPSVPHLNETSLSNNDVRINLQELQIRKKKSDHKERNNDSLRLLNQVPESGSQRDSEKPRLNDVEDEIQDILSKLPPLDLNSIIWDDDNDDLQSDPSCSKQITDAEVDRLHQEHIEGVNGTVDLADHNFKEWYEMVTKRTYNDDFIHILPYTIID